MSNPDSAYYFSAKHDDRRKIYQVAEKSLAEQMEKERTFKGRYLWPMYDSPLLSERDSSSFDSEFNMFAPEGQNLRDYIEEVLRPRKGQAVAIEFGGPGSNLFAGFSEGFFRRSLGVTLKDKRAAVKRSRDKVMNHSVIEGDLRDPFTKSKVNNWLGEDQVDLVFERLGGAGSKIPQDPYDIAQHASEWYKMVAEGGLMFLQVPTVVTPLIVPWLEKIDALYPGLARGGRSLIWLDIQLHKIPGAPDELPLLTPREVRSIYEQIRRPQNIDIQQKYR
jgi:hypothetical protein